MTQIINASGNLGFLKSQTQIAVLVDSNGNIINSLGGSGVSQVNSVNGATGALTFNSNNPNYTYSVNGTTISLNTQGVAVNPVDGPLVTTNNAIAIWSGVNGASLLNTPVTIDSSDLATIRNATSIYAISGIFSQTVVAPVISGTVLSGISISMPTSGLFTQGPFTSLAGTPTGLMLGNIVSQEGYINLFGSVGQTATQSTANIDLENRGPNAFNYSELSVVRSRGTFPSVAAVLSGDNLGHVGWWAAQDTSGNYSNPTYVDSVAIENQSSTRNGGAMRFWITESGSITPTEKFELNASGLGFIGTPGSQVGNGYINSVQQNIRTITTNYTATSTDRTILTNQGSSIQVNLPKSNAGKEYIVLSTVTSAINTVTLSGINCNIDGSSTKTVSSATVGAGIFMFSDGTNFWSINSLI